MPKVSVYLSKKLYDRAVEAGLPISDICQNAIMAALAEEELSLAEKLHRSAVWFGNLAKDTERRVSSGFRKMRENGLDPADYFDRPIITGYDAPPTVGTTAGDEPGISQTGPEPR